MLKDYVYYDSTRSFCSRCGELVDAKIIIKNGGAFLLKTCLADGEEIEVFEEDASYLHQRHRFDKPGNAIRPDVGRSKGCPHDCGVCPDHEQHTCIGLIEVTQSCDLGCPVCYAESGTGEHLPLDLIERMMDFYQQREGGKAEILQIGGGEPASHPEIEQILELAKRKRFRYLMLNTNGLRLATDVDFARFLKSLTPGFEVYLQFDGLQEAIYQKMRGAKLLDTKLAAIRNLQEARVPVTLVATVERGVNDRHIGDIVRFGLENDYVRGINFQPVAYFGRGSKQQVKSRVTLSGIRAEIERQTGGIFRADDIIPLPCDVDRVAVSYAVKKDDRYIPVTSRVQVDGYLELIDNTMDFRAEEIVKNALAKSITKGLACDCFKIKDELADLLPDGYFKWTATRRAEFIDTNTFRITISSFIDRYNFDAKSVKKECVHVITPDLRRIPFSMYNMLHRGDSGSPRPA